MKLSNKPRWCTLLIAWTAKDVKSLVPFGTMTKSMVPGFFVKSMVLYRTQFFLVIFINSFKQECGKKSAWKKVFFLPNSKFSKAR